MIVYPCRMGVHPKAMQARLGHATTNFSLTTYTHNTEKLQAGIADMLTEKRSSSQKVVTAKRIIKNKRPTKTS